MSNLVDRQNTDRQTNEQTNKKRNQKRENIVSFFSGGSRPNLQNVVQFRQRRTVCSEISVRHAMVILDDNWINARFLLRD